MQSPQAPDLNELRGRILANESYTHEELAAAIAALRIVRTETATIVTEKRKKASTVLSDDDLDASLKQAGLDF